MYVSVLGINHHSAPIAVREHVAANTEQAMQLLLELQQLSGINEVMLLSTCNRSELYIEGRALPDLQMWAKQKWPEDYKILVKHSYSYTGKKAVQHVMRVACGLDSMVLGEVEIMGQIKAAYQNAVQQKCMGKVLGRLFQQTFSVAKQVRSETSIGVNSVSVASIATQLSGRIFENLSKRSVLVIGAGNTARLLLKHLYSAGVKNVVIANRTLARAQAVGKSCDLQEHIEYIALEAIPVHLPKVDIVITSTASPLPILGKGMVEKALRIRKHQPIFMVDLAVPRDIEPEVSELSEVFLYCIDDLQAIASENRRSREDAVIEAEEIISEQVEQFSSWLQLQDSVHAIKMFRSTCESYRSAALHNAKRELALGRCPEDVIERLSYQMLNRLIHEPTVQMRAASLKGESDLVDAACQLFNLETKQKK